jgi:hypothetical protein
MRYTCCHGRVSFDVWFGDKDDKYDAAALPDKPLGRKTGRINHRRCGSSLNFGVHVAPVACLLLHSSMSLTT